MEDGFYVSLMVIAVGCVLPIVVVWFGVRHTKNETDQRTKIILAALEKNPEMDLEELMTKISPKKKLLKEKLIDKLQAGSITTLLGVGFLGYCAYLSYIGGSSYVNLTGTCLAGVVLLGVGIALLINYAVGKRMLAKEIEAEQNQMLAQK